MKQCNKIFFSVFVFIFFTCVSVFAQDYSVFKLDNGQTVIIKEVHDNPIVTIDTWIKTGSVNETDKNNGVAHFLEHLFFKGTKKYPTGQFDRILESKGAVTNAATSKDFTHYYITIPSRDFKTAIELHADMLLHPLIPRKELEKERKVVLEEISKTKDSTENRLYEQMNEKFYSNHPYKRNVIGTRQVIETIPREAILEFYNQWYRPSNMITVIVGDVNTEDALNMVKKEFAMEEKEKVKLPEYKMDKNLEKQQEIITNDNVKTGYLLIGFRGVKAADKKEQYALDMLATILGDGRSSKLYHVIKDQKQLAYSISSGHSSMKDDSIFYVQANFKPENLDKLKSSIFCEIEKMRQGSFDEQDIKTAKSIIERDTYYARESTSNVASELGYITLLYNNPDFYDEYIPNIQKVTKNEIVNAAKKYLNPQHAVISVIMPETPIIKKQETKPIADVKKSQAKLINQNQSTKEYKLSNGATLLINNNKLNDIIAIQIFSKGGSFTEQKPGVASVTSSVMLKGTQKFSGIDLSQIMEQNGIKIIPSNTPDSFSVSVKTTLPDLALAMELLSEVMNNATLDEQDIEKVKTEKLAAIEKQRDVPSNVAFEEFRTELWKGTPYGRTGKILEKTIPAITKQEVVNYYKSISNPQNLIISINGNISDKEMINYFDSMFCANNTKSVKYSDYKDLFKPLQNRVFVKKAKDSEAAWVVLGWQTDGLTNIKDAATLQVVDAIMGSGMSSRLFNRLRDEQGLAYQVGSVFVPNVNSGLFAVFIGTNPKTALHSKNEMFKQIDILKKEFVADKELREAKDKILGNFILSQETNAEKAATIGWFEASGRGFDFIDKYPSIIESVTAGDIIRVANKYFNTNKAVITVVAPDEYLKQF